MPQTGWIGKPENYKGLILKFWKDVWGYYRFEISDAQGYLTRIDTMEKNKKEARKMAHYYVDSNLIPLQKQSRKQAEDYQRYLAKIHSN